MRRPEDDLLERLVGYRPRLRLEAIFIEHVAHGGADGPVESAGFRADTAAS
jgi:hypothetical protein